MRKQAHFSGITFHSKLHPTVGSKSSNKAQLVKLLQEIPTKYKFKITNKNISAKSVASWREVAYWLLDILSSR